MTAEHLRCLGQLRYDVGAFINIAKGFNNPAEVMLDGTRIDEDLAILVASNGERHAGMHRGDVQQRDREGTGTETQDTKRDRDRERNEPTHTHTHAHTCTHLLVGVVATAPDTGSGFRV